MPEILVVDDAAFMRTSIKQMLERGGFKVCGEACNGKEAIAKVMELNPEIVTMDITMPDLDGISATKEILKINPNTKVIMVSAMGQEVMIREAIVAGAKNFIVKPFNEEKVLNAINSLL